MARKKFEEICPPDCPVKGALDIVEGKWTLLILRDLMQGPRRFGELKKSLGGLSPNTLTERLRYLEQHKILSKKIYPVSPLKVEYSLTPRGLALREVIQSLGDWGKKWIKRVD